MSVKMYICKCIRTLYRARLSRQGLCLIMLPEVETLVFILLVVTAGAVDVVVDVVADAFTSPRFFNEPMEPFNRSGLSTSGPPNSWSCCNQQHNIASIPSSTCKRTPQKHKFNYFQYKIKSLLFNETKIKVHFALKLIQQEHSTNVFINSEPCEPKKKLFFVAFSPLASWH